MQQVVQLFVSKKMKKKEKKKNNSVKSDIWIMRSTDQQEQWHQAA